ncbi:MAG: DUF1080 domain-containing protein [Bryobacteraceae bacterium]
MRLLLAAWLAMASIAAAQSDFKPLFNGRDLDGWEVDTPGLWQVRDGAIVGRHDGLKYNDFLRTKKHYRNFELRLKFRLINGEGNSGIQFRSKPVPNSHEVSGYQADIGMQYWGCLYDESRRNKILAQANPGSLDGLDKAGWNEYVITAIDNRITLDLNGKRTVDYAETEPGMDEKGFIALQVHSGPKIEVWFKDLYIRELD